MKKLEKIIGYEFSNPLLLERALTHSSFFQNKIDYLENNERLEFIGDALLDAVIGLDLYTKLESLPEGMLTKKRALIVCEKSLALIAREMKLGDYLRIGPGMIAQGGQNNESVLADAVESIIGAIWIDGGYEEARKFILNAFKSQIEKAIKGALFDDYKSALQEIIQQDGKNAQIIYVCDRDEGPSHDKTFYIHVECNGIVLGSGVGKTKKEAEQISAKQAIDTLKKEK